MSKIFTVKTPKYVQRTPLKCKKLSKTSQTTHAQTAKKLDQTPIKSYFDFSTEELGYFTRRDSITDRIIGTFKVSNTR